MVIRKKRIKITNVLHYKSAQMAEMKKQTLTSVDKDVKQLELSYTDLESAIWFKNFDKLFGSLFIFFLLVFLGLYPWHMEIPRLGVELEMQLPPTAMPDLSCVCELHRRLWPCQILLPTEQGQGLNPHPHGY